MAQKRMFDKAIIDTDRFMDLSMTAKAMYFLLGMEADDEGFVSYKKVLRIHGGNEDDVKILIAKSFILSFPSGVVVITDWNSNNYLDKNRIRQTEYQAEKNLLALTDNKKYEFNNCLTDVKPEEYRREENSIEEKRKYGEFKNVSLSDEEVEKLKDQYGYSASKNLVEELSSYLRSSGKRYKSHYATLLNWARRKGVEKIAPKKIVESTTLTPEQITANKERIAKIKTGLVNKFKS